MAYLAVSQNTYGQVVISQVWGGGGTAAGQPNADYVELFNTGNSAQSLVGWSVQCASATGAFGGATSKVDLVGTIEPRRYFCVRLQAESATGDPYVADQSTTGITALVSTSGKVALCNSTALLPSTPNPLTCAQFTTIVDFVGYGTTANVREPCSSTMTSNNAPAGSTSGDGATPHRRCRGFTDSNTNNADFVALVPSPRNASTPENSGLELTASATPPTVERGSATAVLFTVARTVCNGGAPSTGGTVTADLTRIGGSATQAFFDDMTNGDVTAGDNIYSYSTTVPVNVTSGSAIMPVTLVDAQARTATGTFSLNITSPPAPNDECDDAVVITTVPFLDDLIDNTMATDDRDVSCNVTSATVTRFGVWYSYTPATSGVALLSETGTQDVVMAVFTGPDCDPGNLAEEACFTTDTNQAYLMEADTQYRILVGLSSGSATPPTGTLIFSFDFVPTPDNDLCENATVLTTFPFTESVRLTAATDDLDVTCNTGTGFNTRFGVWYTYTPAADGTLVINESSTQDAVHAVFSGGTTCNSFQEVFCSNTDTNQSYAVTNNTQYWILLGHGSSTTTTRPLPAYEYSINFETVPPPANDMICDAVVVGSLPFSHSVDNRGATDDPDVQCNATNAPATRLGVWYTYTPSSDCVVIVTESSNQDVVIAVFQGGDCFGAFETHCTSNDSLSLALTGNTQYWFLVGANAAQPGFPTQSLSLNFDCRQPPANDTCAGATVVGALPFNAVVDNSAATDDADVSCNISSAQATKLGVWFTYTPANTCTAAFGENSSQDTVTVIFTGPDCGSLSEVFCTGTELGNHFDLFGGQQYWFLVGSAAANPAVPTVSLDFSLDCTPPVPLESCITAEEITSLPFTTEINNGTFTANGPGGPCDTPVPPQMQNDVWFRHTATSDCIMTVSMDPITSYAGVLVVYEGPNCQNLVFVRCSDNTTSGAIESFNFPAITGLTYWIQFGDDSTTEGGGDTALAIDCGPAPTNDTCSGATLINGLPFSDTVDNARAQDDVDVSCNVTSAQATKHGVWYTYTPATDCTLLVNETSTQDVVLALFSGTDCSSLFEVACTANEATAFALTGNVQYWVLVGNPAAVDLLPTIPLTVEFDCVQAPANDQVCSATVITTTPFSETISNGAATDDMDVTCNVTSAAASKFGIWYTYTPSVDCTGLISDSSTQDIFIATFTGPDCNNLTEVACTTSEATSVAMLAGTQYWILIASPAADPATPTVSLQIAFDCVQPPANDMPCGATVITSTPFSDSLNNAAATDDPDVSCNISSATATKLGVWYTYTPSMNCTGVIGETSTQDIVIAVYTGANCSNLDQPEFLCTGNESASLPMVAGTQYWFLIGSASGAPATPTVNLAVNFDCVQPPANDMPCGATVVTGLPFSDSVQNAAATDDVDTTCNTSSATATRFGVWYTYTATNNCSLGLTELSSQDVVMAVFTGPDCNNLSEVFCTGTETGQVFPIVLGTQYWILVGSAAAAPAVPTVPLSVMFDCVVIPLNETCALAETIPSLPFSASYTLINTQPGLPAGTCNEFCSPCTQMLQDVWFKYTATATCDVTLTIQGGASPIDPMCEVYVGEQCGTCTQTGCTGLTQLFCLNRPAGNDGPIGMTFTVTAGQTYWFQQGDTGTIVQAGATVFSLVGSNCTVACSTCPGDMDGDMAFTGSDIQDFVQCVIDANGGAPPTGCVCADVNTDALVNDTDVAALIDRLLMPPDCP